MKVFVYDKKNSKKIAELQDVTNAVALPYKKFMLVSKNGDTITYNTKEVKITIYQN